ncbi:unnamed protein product [Amoebophrya sp. A120]|nr:unnamed protein product [Amoebophrya sp. A120]|eukprot:GSA120T00014946001.1
MQHYAKKTKEKVGMVGEKVVTGIAKSLLGIDLSKGCRGNKEDKDHNGEFNSLMGDNSPENNKSKSNKTAKEEKSDIEMIDEQLRKLLENRPSAENNLSEPAWANWWHPTASMMGTGDKGSPMKKKSKEAAQKFTNMEGMAEGVLRLVLKVNDPEKTSVPLENNDLTQLACLTKSVIALGKRLSKWNGLDLSAVLSELADTAEQLQSSGKKFKQEILEENQKQNIQAAEESGFPIAKDKVSKEHQESLHFAEKILEVAGSTAQLCTELHTVISEAMFKTATGQNISDKNVLNKIQQNQLVRERGSSQSGGNYSSSAGSAAMSMNNNSSSNSSDGSNNNHISGRAVCQAVFHWWHAKKAWFLEKLLRNSLLEGLEETTSVEHQHYLLNHEREVALKERENKGAANNSSSIGDNKSASACSGAAANSTAAAAPSKTSSTSTGILSGFSKMFGSTASKTLSGLAKFGNTDANLRSQYLQDHTTKLLFLKFRDSMEDFAHLLDETVLTVYENESVLAVSEWVKIGKEVFQEARDLKMVSVMVNFVGNELMVSKCGSGTKFNFFNRNTDSVKQLEDQHRKRLDRQKANKKKIPVTSTFKSSPYFNYSNCNEQFFTGIGPILDLQNESMRIWTEASASRTAVLKAIAKTYEREIEKEKTPKLKFDLVELQLPYLQALDDNERVREADGLKRNLADELEADLARADQNFARVADRYFAIGVRSLSLDLDRVAPPAFQLLTRGSTFADLQALQGRNTNFVQAVQEILKVIRDHEQKEGVWRRNISIFAGQMCRQCEHENLCEGNNMKDKAQEFLMRIGLCSRFSQHTRRKLIGDVGDKDGADGSGVVELKMKKKERKETHAEMVKEKDGMRGKKDDKKAKEKMKELKTKLKDLRIAAAAGMESLDNSDDDADAGGGNTGITTGASSASSSSKKVAKFKKDDDEDKPTILNFPIEMPVVVTKIHYTLDEFPMIEELLDSSLLRVNQCNESAVNSCLNDFRKRIHLAQRALRDSGRLQPRRRLREAIPFLLAQRFLQAAEETRNRHFWQSPWPQHGLDRVFRMAESMLEEHLGKANEDEEQEQLEQEDPLFFGRGLVDIVQSLEDQIELVDPKPGYADWLTEGERDQARVALKQAEKNQDYLTAVTESYSLAVSFVDHEVSRVLPCADMLNNGASLKDLLWVQTADHVKVIRYVFQRIAECEREKERQVREFEIMFGCYSATCSVCIYRSRLPSPFPLPVVEEAIQVLQRLAFGGLHYRKEIYKYKENHDNSKYLKESTAMDIPKHNKETERFILENPEVTSEAECKIEWVQVMQPDHVRHFENHHGLQTIDEEADVYGFGTSGRGGGPGRRYGSGELEITDSTSLDDYMGGGGSGGFISYGNGLQVYKPPSMFQSTKMQIAKSQRDAYIDARRFQQADFGVDKHVVLGKNQKGVDLKNSKPASLLIWYEGQKTIPLLERVDNWHLFLDESMSQDRDHGGSSTRAGGAQATSSATATSLLANNSKKQLTNNFHDVTQPIKNCVTHLNECLRLAKEGKSQSKKTNEKQEKETGEKDEGYEELLEFYGDLTGALEDAVKTQTNSAMDMVRVHLDIN